MESDSAGSLESLMMSDDIAYEPHDRVSWFGFWMISVNAMMGTGFLSIGASHRYGVGLSLLVNAVTCVLSFVGNMMLYWNADQVDACSHEGLWAAAFGAGTAFIPNILMILLEISCIEMYAANIIKGYELLIGEKTVVWATEFEFSRPIVIFCFWLVGVLPMCFINKMRHVVWPCVVAFLCILLIVIYFGYTFVGQFMYNHWVLDPAGEMVWFSHDEMINMLQDFLFAYCSAPVMFTATKDVRVEDRSMHRIGYITLFPLLTAFLSYLVSGLSCYFTLYSRISGLYPGNFMTDIDGRWTGLAPVHTAATIVMIIFLLMSIALYVTLMGNSIAQMLPRDSQVARYVAVVSKIVLTFVVMGAAGWSEVVDNIAVGCINFCCILLCYAFVPLVTFVFRGFEDMFMFFVNMIFAALAGLLTIFLFR